VRRTLRTRFPLLTSRFLAQPIRLPRPAVTGYVDLSSVPVGITDTRQWWRVPVLGHHLLIAGASGAGKGSVLWSLIAGLAPSIKTGQVRLCVIDPKGGMELGAGAALFSAFSHDVTEITLDVLRRLVTVMHARANRLRGHTRLHTPTPSEPLFVVVIDEIAALTAYVTDRKVRTEIEHLLGLLLSQGRAVGISVVAAIQDPSKETLPVRQLFTVRIGLRLTEASQTAMVLGQGARDAGAECDLIADTTPGVGYVRSRAPRNPNASELSTSPTKTSPTSPLDSALAGVKAMEPRTKSTTPAQTGAIDECFSPIARPARRYRPRRRRRSDDPACPLRGIQRLVAARGSGWVLRQPDPPSRP
jgi:hypothetical protein